jgi:hypothetical protein
LITTPEQVIAGGRAARGRWVRKIAAMVIRAEGLRVAILPTLRRWGRCIGPSFATQTGRGAQLGPEVLAKVKPAHLGIVHDIILAALHQNLAGVNDIGSIGQIEGFAHVMIGN